LFANISFEIPQLLAPIITNYYLKCHIIYEAIDLITLLLTCRFCSALITAVI